MIRFRRIVAGLMAMPIVRDIVTLQVGSAINIALTLVASVVYARLLGVSGFGQYAVALAFSSTASAICNIGQGPALFTFLAEEHGKRDREGMGRVISYSLSVNALFGLVLLGVAWAAPAICQHLYGSRDLGVLARLAVLNVILSTISGLCLAIFQTVREMRWYVLFDQGATALELALGIMLVLLDGGPIGIFQALIAVQLICLPLFLWRYSRLAKRHVLPRWTQCLRLDWNSWRHYVGQGFLIGVDKNVSKLFPNGLLTVLRIGSSDAVVGLARIVFQAALIPQLLLLTQSGQMAMTVLPGIAARGTVALRKAAIKLLKHTLLLHTLISLCCMLAMPFMVLLFYGSAYRDAIEPALWLILISILQALSISNGPLLRVLRRTWISTIVNLASLAVCVGAFLVLLPIVSALTALVVTTLLYYIMQQATTIIIYDSLLRRSPRVLRTVPKAGNGSVVM
jgi:O-antigen/teichoic acid export membrane protein